MARAAVLGRLTWRVATIAGIREETASARTLVLDVPDWPGHLAGQHVDVKLTAPDGYSAQRSYSIASAPTGSTVELTIQRVPDGEVSSYLVDDAIVGDQFELRGPVGGYFTWQPIDLAPVLLLAGGSGIVPLMAMIRTRAAGSDPAATSMAAPFRLVYSVREPAGALYAEELSRRVREDEGLQVAYVYTRATPTDWPRPPGRLDALRLGEAGFAARTMPQCYVCGPTPFVEAAANLLVDAGHPPLRIRTERFGPTGG
jgi:ferredoxin-NADP reductase